MPVLEDYTALVVFEDDDLLVVNKPARWNTHAPSPFAGNGLYEWLREREPRWQNLSILHRLDKETSGLLVFGKSPAANRSLTQQFTEREVHKRYLLLTDRPVPREAWQMESEIVRLGDHYISRPSSPGVALAQTRFRRLESAGSTTLVEATPLTGRTHQIRVHAAAANIPILGDAAYGGTEAPRLYLQACELAFRHPTTAQPFELTLPSDFDRDAALELRRRIIDSSLTNCYRIVHGRSDGWPDWYVDRLGDFLLAQSDAVPEAASLERLKQLMVSVEARGVYHKVLTRQVRQAAPGDTSPRHLCGEVAPDPLFIHENGLSLELSLQEGYSVGLFLDQRENRRRLLTHYVGPNFFLSTPGASPLEVLNTFAYTCAFSVAAAKAGARVTSIDLSKKYLAWGQRNFERNDLGASAHEFLSGDVFDWVRRLGKKKRSFDIVLLDPPTFSTSKVSGAFRAEKDYARLVTAVLPLIKPQGHLFASSNASRLSAEEFLAQITSALMSGGRRILKQHYAAQPPDFPISRGEPGYLKTCWFQVH